MTRAIVWMGATVATVTLAACAAADPDLDTTAARTSYAVGVDVGNSLKRAGVEVDVDVFAAAVADVMAERDLKMSSDEIAAAFQEMQQAHRDRQQTQNAEALAVRDSLAQHHAEAGQAFLAENGRRDGIETTASGLQYEVLREGSDASPDATDLATVHYRGTLLDGTEFDSSYEGEPVTFPLNGVIPGWTEILQLMHVDSKFRVWIPGHLAYGVAGQGQIPPNATLVFEIELLAVETPPGDDR